MLKNTEQMVSVPRELLERCDFGRNTETALAALPELRAILAKPAAQHQGEKFTYSSKQATNCAGCGTRKHTPLRVDGMGGYVCLTCIDQKLESLLSPQEHQGEPGAFEVDVSSYSILLCKTQDKAEKTASHYRALGHAVDIRPLYRHSPTSDGFSAGDMADQGAKAFRDGQRALALPERRQWNGLGNAADNLKASGWNACLDEVRRLNEASISPE